MKKLVSLILCLALLATMTVIPAMAEETYREPVTLTMFSGLANYAGEQQGWFAKELKDRFNVTLKYISTNVDPNAWTAAVAAGDIGDIICLGDMGDQFIEALKADLLLDWNDVDLTPYTNINAYLGDDDTVVIPEEIEGRDVTTVAAGAFENSTLRHVVLPMNMDQVAPDAFKNSAVETVTLFDNIQVISDTSFEGCEDLQTLYINAYEAPYGYEFRKESIYADKVDRLILAQGRKKMVFYAGCSVWYNLDGTDMRKAFQDEYVILNMGLNGTVNSAVQMQILAPYLEKGDVFVHTLELTSPYQLLSSVQMGRNDDKLWCGLEYNYDLFTHVDLRTVEGEFDSLVSYLDSKSTRSSYSDHFTDEDGNEYLDEYGGVPFHRDQTRDTLADQVRLDPEHITSEGMARLESYYNRYQRRGVTVYVSYACVNMDEVPENERSNVALMDSTVREAVAAMDDVALISELRDFLYVHDDFYDTNYHLLTKQTRENTAVWIRDLQAQMAADGLWKGAE